MTHTPVKPDAVTLERDVQSDEYTVTVRLAGSADLRHTIAGSLLTMLCGSRDTAEKVHAVAIGKWRVPGQIMRRAQDCDVHQAYSSLASALQQASVTLTPEQANATAMTLRQVADDLEEAALEPKRCDIAGCQGYTDIDFCGDHLDAAVAGVAV